MARCGDLAADVLMMLCRRSAGAGEGGRVLGFVSFVLKRMMPTAFCCAGNGGSGCGRAGSRSVPACNCKGDTRWELLPIHKHRWSGANSRPAHAESWVCFVMMTDWFAVGVPRLSYCGTVSTAMALLSYVGDSEGLHDWWSAAPLSIESA